MAAAMDFKQRNEHLDEISLQMNEKLPVRLSSTETAKNPEFVKLLFQLSQFVLPDGTSAHFSQGVATAKKVLTKQKERYLQNYVLHDELQELLLDQQIESVQTATPKQSQFYTTVSEMLNTAEIGDYIGCSQNSDSSATLLGVSLSELEKKNPHGKLIQSVQQKLIPELELRLRKRCEALVSFHSSSSEVGAGDSAQLAFAKVSQLPAALLEQMKMLENEKKELKRDTHKRQFLFTRYQQTISESLELASRLLDNYRLKLRPENDKITSEWLMARCDALCLKIRVLELQLMYDTYHTDTVRALNTIRLELNLSISETEEELNRVSQLLKTYEAVGMGFGALVNQFMNLREEVDNKKWALHELKKHDITSELQS